MIKKKQRGKKRMLYNRRWMCGVWGAHLLLQKSNLACVVGVLAASSGSQESFFRTSPIWWLHSITADSREWMTPASTSPLWNFHIQLFLKQSPALDSALSCCMQCVSSTFCLAPGKLAPLSLSPQGEAAESCLGLGPISRKRWSWGHGRGAWYPETQPVAIHFGSGCCTEEVPQPGGVCGQGRNDGFSRNDRCRFERLQFNFQLTFSLLS